MAGGTEQGQQFQIIIPDLAPTFHWEWLLTGLIFPLVVGLVLDRRRRRKRRKQ